MKTATRKIRSPLKWHGGKSYLARRIISLFPKARCFAEHFAGGMSIGLNVEPPEFQFANDLNPTLMTFWRELRDVFGGRLQADIRDLAYSREVFERALAVQVEPLVPAARALAFYVLNRMSRGGLGKDFAGSGAASPATSTPGRQ